MPEENNELKTGTDAPEETAEKEESATTSNDQDQEGDVDPNPAEDGETGAAEEDDFEEEDNEEEEDPSNLPPEDTDWNHLGPRLWAALKNILGGNKTHHDDKIVIDASHEDVAEAHEVLKQ